MGDDLIIRRAVLEVIGTHPCDTSKILEGVLDLPIAYNVNDAVELLEFSSRFYEKALRDCDEKFKLYFLGASTGFGLAAEIVKAGGVE